MKYNKTHKRNKNTKKFNINTGKKEKRKTIKMKRSNSLIGGEGPLKFPSVDIIAKFIRKQDKDNYKDVNRFDINIKSHYSFLDYLFEVEDFLKRFELDLLNYTDKSEYVKLMQTYKDTESKKSMQITIGKKGDDGDGDGENEDDDDHDEEEEEEEEDRDEEEEENFFLDNDEKYRENINHLNNPSENKFNLFGVSEKPGPMAKITADNKNKGKGKEKTVVKKMVRGKR
jgi:hypothetical protein